jgi:hypothetical protein
MSATKIYCEDKDKVKHKISQWKKWNVNYVSVVEFGLIFLMGLKYVNSPHVIYNPGLKSTMIIPNKI